MIKKINRIILLGTSHVAKQSKEEIERVIEIDNPEVVAIELDYDRLRALMAKNKPEEKKYTFKMIKEYGVTGFLFALIGSSVQNKVGNSLGIDPGVDMKSAYVKAREKKIPVALIDLPLKVVLRKMSALSIWRKLKMFFSLFFKSFKKEYRNKFYFDVKKGVPDDKFITEVLKMLKKEVPDMYQILIEDRNIHMSKRVMDLYNKHEGNILVVVGAGHVEGMSKILENNFNQDNFNFSFNVEV